MDYYAALKNRYGTLPGSLADKIVALNANVVNPDVSMDVPIGSVIGYLAVTQKLAGLIHYASTASIDTAAGIAAKEFVTMVQSPQVSVFETSQPSILAAVTGLLGALVTDAATGITADDTTAILDMAQTTEPGWKALALNAPVGINDLIAARLETSATLEAAGFLGYADAEPA